MTAGPKAPKGVTRAAVLAILLREADMDGLVTISEREIGAELGTTQPTIGYHIANLAADGLLTVIQHGSYQALNAIQLAEAVFAA